ncbi:MAG TPA: SDR family NAD(P)-dependent oxidoreductase, partial [Chloroflexota bacterium]
LTSLRADHDDWQQVLESVGELYVRGVTPDWAALEHGQPPRRRVRLPTYPFQRSRYWVAAPDPEPGFASVAQQVVHTFELSTSTTPLLLDHQVRGTPVVPAAYHLVRVLEAGERLFGTGSTALEDTLLSRVMSVGHTRTRQLELVLEPDNSDSAAWTLGSSQRDEDEAATTYARGFLKLRNSPESAAASESVANILSRCTSELSGVEFYRVAADAGLELGSAFQRLNRLWYGEGEVLAEVHQPAELRDARGLVDAALVDACIQALAATLPGEPALYLPEAVAHVRVTDSTSGAAWCHARLKPGSQVHKDIAEGDVRLLDEGGHVILELTGVRLRQAGPSTAALFTSQDPAELLHRMEWRPSRRASRAQFGPRTPGHWLVFADRAGLGAAAADRLTAAGERRTLVYPGDAYGRHADGSWRLSPSDPTHFRRLLEDTGAPLAGVVHLWTLDTPELKTSERQSTAGAWAVGCESALHLVQALAMQTAHTIPPRLWLVTRGAQAVDEGQVNPAQATVWGLARVVALEHPQLRCARLDLAPAQDSDEPEALVEELLADDTEDQIAFRGSTRYVLRLVRDEGPRLAAPPPDGPFRLAIHTPGILDKLVFEPCSRRAPGPGEVEIRIRATGLNFRDVLATLDLYPGNAIPLGNECAGEIATLGSEVEGLAVGDQVVALAPGSFANYVTTRADFVAHRPDHIGAEEAATIPVAFLTASIGLLELAGLRAGERVLIHSAAGGVGMAAVQLAMRGGAEVFATASPAKWDALREMGVRQLMSSRTLEFAEQIQAATGGQGVDVVLNSLSDAFIPASLSVLREGGRFIELGKRGIWNAEQAAQLCPDVVYQPFDLGELLRDDPQRVRSAWNDLIGTFASHGLEPLRHRVFPIEQTVAAFRYMAQARHTGKVVISQSSKQSAGTGDIRLRADSAYLITGGLGALGLETARALVRTGARHLALLSRRPPDDETSATLAELRANGVNIVVLQADVAQFDQLAAALERIDTEMPPLRGVVHAAGVLDDATLIRQDWQRFMRVLSPKVEGAWNLHCLTHDRPLDFFVLFSSAAALLGSAGQANYAAANAFLDALAHRRRFDGLAALSINWGPWTIGMAAGLAEHASLHERGLAALSPVEGARILTQHLNATGQIAVIRAAWPVFARHLPVGSRLPLLAELAPGDGVDRLPKLAGGDETWREVRRLAPPRRRADLGKLISLECARVMGLPAAISIDPRRPLHELGLDSLMAVELRNVLGQKIGRTLSATLLFDYPSVDALADFLDDLLDLDASANGDVPRASPAAAQANRLDLGKAIAIVGIGCRFPGGADSPDTFWDLLRDGTDAVIDVPSDRWDVDAYYDPDPEAGRIYTRRGAFIDHVDQFDAAFFGISPREAVMMDPQQRLLLEVTSEALEDAGQSPEALVGSQTGVFVGISTSDYADLFRGDGDLTRVDAYTGTGSLASVAAGRLSYALGLQGPSMSLDTACSSSLVALHLACQSLRQGESDLALAAGVNVILAPEGTLYFCKLRALAPDGRCKAFDAAADGYVRGEGCGVIVLKRLPDALRDGDRILALVRGSAVNQDGRSNGLTAPNGPAQEAVIRKALAQADVA